MPEYKSYSLQGGQPVKISPFVATEAGTFFAGEGCAFNPVVVTGGGSSEPYGEEIQNPCPVRDGFFIYVGAGMSDIVAAVCEIRNGQINISAGDGTFSIDSTGDVPMLVWTPSIEVVAGQYAYISEIVQPNSDGNE